MQIFQNPSSPVSFETALILGNFDGFHRAHQALAARAVAYAKEHALTPCACTLICAPNKGRILSSDEEKIRFLKSAGIEVLFAFDFARIKDKTAEEFVKTTLLDTLGAKALFCGFNYRFARNRSADSTDLIRLAKGRAEVVVLPPFCDEEGELISSSKIRALLDAGKINEAEKLLGRPL